MNAFSASLSRAASQVSWWIGPKQDVDERRPATIDTDELSEHMLRDIGIVDGRPTRGERSDTDDLAPSFEISPKRFV